MTTWIEPFQLQGLEALSKRLYTENRMDGDEMRNAAQLLDAIVRDLKYYAEKDE